jgi:hypothetical protein
MSISLFTSASPPNRTSHQRLPHLATSLSVTSCLPLSPPIFLDCWTHWRPPGSPKRMERTWFIFSLATFSWKTGYSACAIFAAFYSHPSVVSFPLLYCGCDLYWRISGCYILLLDRCAPCSPVYPAFPVAKAQAAKSVVGTRAQLVVQLEHRMLFIIL